MGMMVQCLFKGTVGETVTHTVERNGNDGPHENVYALGEAESFRGWRAEERGVRSPRMPTAVSKLRGVGCMASGSRATPPALSAPQLLASLYPLGSGDSVSFPFLCKPIPGCGVRTTLLSPQPKTFILCLCSCSVLDTQKCANSEFMFQVRQTWVWTFCQFMDLDKEPSIFTVSVCSFVIVPTYSIIVSY